MEQVKKTNMPGRIWSLTGWRNR